jgi:uncharacterized protein YdaU (DUF1376 family)
MSEAPSFPFYANDFVGGRVATYDLDEIGAYSLLLAFDWTLNGLPTETERLAKLCRVSHRKFLKIWEVIAEQFPERDGRRFNERLALERAKKGIKSASASDAANKRWHSAPDADASGQHAQNDATTTSPLPGDLERVVVPADAKVRLVAAANKGLAEHPVCPQPIPRILHSQGTALTATTAILQAGVPLDFAESRVYAIARSHNADGAITSLGYFTAAVIRAWSQQLAADQSRASTATAPRNGRKPDPRTEPGAATYEAGMAAIRDL